MLHVITGGSGSGKSEYAESAAVKAFEKLQNKEGADQNGETAAADGGGGRLYYVATMQPFDDECLKRIARHRKMRAKKGFSTIECYTRLEEVQAKKEDVILLECMSNLAANERYAQKGRIRGNGKDALQQAKEAIIDPVLALCKSAGCVVIVTNEVFSDGMNYDEESREYCRLLGFINQELAKKADSVVEVVCSIPVCRKGELPC